METYKIVRFFKAGGQEVQQEGLTLEQAQEHCNRKDTKGDTWFDGYENESKS